ncbi:hypothetical protein N9W04_02945 [Alphaproteobacteria bacterium]|nr:hypothetical protein [Alphaproteobacteria bacterium]
MRDLISNIDLDDKNYDKVEGYVVGIDEANDFLLATYRLHRETKAKYRLMVCEGGYWITSNKYIIDDVIVIKHNDFLNIKS